MKKNSKRIRINDMLIIIEEFFDYCYDEVLELIREGIRKIVEINSYKIINLENLSKRICISIRVFNTLSLKQIYSKNFCFHI